MTRILIADDNDINCRLFGWQLEILGFSCDTANSGQSALDACSTQAYDLVFLDVHLGDMDGYDVARALREREREHLTGQRTVIIAATAHTGGEEQKRCLAAGMDDFASKPVTLAPLARLLVRWGARGYDTAADEPDAWLSDAAVEWLRALEARVSEPGLARTLAYEYLDQAAAHERALRAALQGKDEAAPAHARFAWQRFSTGIGALRLARAIAESSDTPESIDHLAALLAETRSALETRFP